MYLDVTDDFVTAIQKASRTYETRIKINDKWYYGKLKNLNITSGASESDDISIGSAVSSKFEITMSSIDELFENTECELQQGILLEDGTYEYIPMGLYTAQKPEEEGELIKFTAYDRMIKTEKVYVSNLNYPATVSQIINEICSICNIPMAIDDLEDVYINTKPNGYTCREMLGYAAGLYGKFAVINRFGQLQLKWYEDANYIVLPSRLFSFKTNQTDFELGFLACNINKSEQIKVGNGFRGITFDNPFMTKERLESLFAERKDLTYRPATAVFFGDIRLDVWDIITVTYLDGNKYKVPVMSLVQKYDGGVSTEVTAYGKTEEETETDFKGPVTKSLQRTYEELLLVNILLATKVDADWVRANTITTDKLDAVNAEILSIKSNYLKVAEADLKYATIENLKAVEATFNTFYADEFSAAVGNIQDLTVSVEKVNTLMFGSATGSSLTTEFSNSVVSLIGDAQIKSAMIKDIAADKITSGKLYTNLVEICSESGNLDIADNTIKISDDADTARVQIGKDASGDYNMYVWDASGNLMFDALGLTEDGVQRAIIRNDMVKDDANISASKLDITSLFTEINGSNETIKSSRIYVDADKQTLDVSIKTMQTDVSALSTTVSTQGTAISTVQGQISSKVWQQDITTATSEISDTVTALSNSYTSLSQTVNSLSATVSSNTKNINSVSATLTTVQADLSGFKTSVSSTYATKDSLSNYSTTTQMNSAISQKSDSILATVSATYATQATVNGIQVGGRNLILNSNFSNGANSWGNWGSPTTREIVTINSKKWAHIKGTGNALYQGYLQLTGIQVEKNTKYTFSARVKGASANQVFTFGIHWNQGSTIVYQTWKSFEVSETEQIVTASFTSPSSDIDRFRIMLGVNSNTTVYEVYFTDLKFEKGNKATDWTPAPEDTQASLELKVNKDTLISEINAAADKISLTADRLSWSSTYSSMTSDGTLTCKNIVINGGKVSIDHGTVSGNFSTFRFLDLRCNHGESKTGSGGTVILNPQQYATMADPGHLYVQNETSGFYTMMTADDGFKLKVPTGDTSTYSYGLKMYSDYGTEVFLDRDELSMWYRYSNGQNGKVTKVGKGYVRIDALNDKHDGIQYFADAALSVSGAPIMCDAQIWSDVDGAGLKKCITSANSVVLLWTGVRFDAYVDGTRVGALAFM